uniref:Uncharacterized protein n=1 Tax=Anguilla anguilla TaxID=7936 RepID=A0A0E9UMD6_ANGAN
MVSKVRRKTREHVNST